MTVAVVLGLDPQPSRLGLALCELEPPYRALWADTVRIDLPDGGWLYQQIGVALRTMPRWEITRIGIELPPFVNSRKTHQQISGVFALCCAEAHRRWPWAPQIPLAPAVWKKATVGKGNASKAEVLRWSIPRYVMGHDRLTLTQDSADALAIAVAAAQVELEVAA